MSSTVSVDRFITALERTEFGDAPEGLLRLVEELFDDPAADLQRLSAPALRLLERLPEERALDHPLLHRVLRRTIVTELRWELLLTRVWRTCARDSMLFASLEQQARNNQYVWDDGQAEACPTERGWQASACPPVAARVQRQYEQFPYPRYVAVPRPRVEDAGAALRILVAGCGTGQEALDLAQRFPASRVTAFDFSAPALAYGTQMARENGIANVDFVRASIDDAARWPERFDRIEAFGVLHHTPDIEASCRALLRLLAPRGTMRVGLYDRDGRAWVADLRRRFAAGVDPWSPASLRAVRARIIREEPERIARSLDFYTMSGFRDLLFHEHECGVTREDIIALAARLGVQLGPIEQPSETMFVFTLRQ
jgi:SAM-dependent methyltransferase